MKSYGVTIQMKRLWQNVGVVPVISLDFPKSNLNILVNFFFGSTIVRNRVKPNQPKFFLDTLQFSKPCEAKTDSTGCSTRVFTEVKDVVVPQPQRLRANIRLLPLFYILVNLLLVVLYGIQKSYSLQYDGYHATYSLLIGFFKNGGKHNAETNGIKISPYGGMGVRYGIGEVWLW